MGGEYVLKRGLLHDAIYTQALTHFFFTNSGKRYLVGWTYWEPSSASEYFYCHEILPPEDDKTGFKYVFVNKGDEANQQIMNCYQHNQIKLFWNDNIEKYNEIYSCIAIHILTTHP